MGRGNESCLEGLSHKTKMAAPPPRPYLLETFKNRLPCNQKAIDLNVWYAALETWL